MIKIKKYFNNKNTLVVISIIALAGIIAGLYIFMYKDSQDTSVSKHTTLQEENINLSPPTEEDEQRVEENKQRIVEQQEKEKAQLNQNDGIRNVIPIITYAGQYNNNIEVGAFVSDIFEDNGTCTAIFSRSSKKIEKDVEAVKNVNSVDCPSMIFSINDFPEKGQWSVIVKYSSQNAAGSSEPKTIEVN